MLRSLKVKDYMTRDPLSFKPQMEVLEAVHLLLTHELSGAPVVDDTGRLVGFLSERDCLKAALNASYYEEFGGQVSQFMTAPAVSIDAESTLTDAAEMFVSQHRRCYPVMEDGRLVGQLSRHDTLAALERLW
ncbi:CBS domain-containing protein [Denitromonas iodatirespirans]|uniref:CBS domain-containing protein n=1 Tax=Denitromonas iodatirespirans TaxID=2795389 RepID=A0A944DMW4_DENI1|nr:CBS domain-containing protein [Denitromonas iodatirespirans]MBT0961564.1 CBS domain-containing protein [Denitromonas iodatirespirans]